MKRTITQGTVILFAAAAAALAACGDDEGGTNSTPTGGSTSTGGDGGSTNGGSTNGGATSGGSTSGGATNGGATNGGSAGDTGSAGVAGAAGEAGSAGEAGAAGSAGAGGAGGSGGSGGTGLTPEEERADAETEAITRCEGLSGWSKVTWLTVGDDPYTTNNEATELVHGLPGNDTLTLSYGTFCALGGKGDDTLTVAGTSVGVSTVLVGGAGKDKFRYSLTPSAYNIYVPDFETDNDQVVFDSTAYSVDPARKLVVVPDFTQVTTTTPNSPTSAYTVVVSPSASGTEVWLTNNNEGFQKNYRIMYLAGYTTYSAADFVFE